MAQTPKHRLSARLPIVLGALLILIIAAAALLSFEGAGAPAKHPDLRGVWNRYPPYPDTFSTAPEPAELQVVEPPLKAPYLEQWRAMRKRRADADAAGTPLPTPSSLCQPEGMPGIMGAHYAMEFLDTGSQMTVVAEFLSQVRRIYIDTPMPARDTIEPTFQGFSVGRWAGDTLEVQTYGVKTDVQYEDIPHSENMQITERWHLIAPDILQNDIKIVDPAYLAKPYTFSFKYKRESKDYKMSEYTCENQRHEM